MIERRGGACFALEPLAPIPIARKPGSEHFECDVPAESRIFGHVHFAHAAGPKQPFDSIVAEPGSDHLSSDYRVTRKHPQARQTAGNRLPRAGDVQLGKMPPSIADDLYLFRSATAGSIRAARQAGPAIASAAVIATSIVTTANVTKSSGCTPNNTEPINRPKAAASIKPTTAPAVTTRS